EPRSPPVNATSRTPFPGPGPCAFRPAGAMRRGLLRGTEGVGARALRPSSFPASVPSPLLGDDPRPVLHPLPGGGEGRGPAHPAPRGRAPGAGAAGGLAHLLRHVPVGLGAGATPYQEPRCGLPPDPLGDPGVRGTARPLLADRVSGSRERPVWADRESNSDPFRDWILNPARLPVSPSAPTVEAVEPDTAAPLLTTLRARAHSPRGDVVLFDVDVDATRVVDALDLDDALVGRGLQHPVVAAAAGMLGVHRAPQRPRPEESSLVHVRCVAVDQHRAEAGVVHGSLLQFPREVYTGTSVPGSVDRQQQES